MFNRIKNLIPTTVPADIRAAVVELEEAKLSRLKAHSDAEYAASQVLKYNAAAEFHHNRVERLTRYLAEEGSKLPISMKDWNGD